MNQSFDSAGRITQLTSNLVNAQHPPTLATVDPSVGYYPTGAIQKVTLGNALTETAAYNSRLQPCRMNVNSTGGHYSQCTDAAPSGNVLDFTYGFNAGTDNGNITFWSAAGNQTFSRTFTYDSLNRIATMADSASSQACKGLSWTIDPGATGPIRLSPPAPAIFFTKPSIPAIASWALPSNTTPLGT